MMDMTEALGSTPWLVWLVVLPLVGALLSLILPRHAAAVGILSAGGVLLAAAGLLFQIARQGAQHYLVGGWQGPLGIALHADSLNGFMLMMSAVVGMGVSLYAPAYFRDQAQHKAALFWPLWLLLWTALNALFVANDIFNLYVTFELLGLSAVALVTLAGGRDALLGAMRYLLVSLLGSLLYLLGVAFIYHSYASLDIGLLGNQVGASASSYAAMGLISLGLLLKTALFPLHFWLPPAHASAPAPVSALLSALVIKASFYVMLRLWLSLFTAAGAGLEFLLALLGAAAILWGSLQALLQTRLKLLVAYSTVAQVGYLFLAIPLVSAGSLSAWGGLVYFALSHGIAKAAMFLAAGNILHFGAHDRILDLDRLVQRLPISITAFGLAGISIMGLPPSGGFVAKWLLLTVAIEQGQWAWALVILAGSLLAAAYVFKVLGHAFTQAQEMHQVRAVPASMEWSALALAVCAILLGVIAPQPLALLEADALVNTISRGQP